MVVRDIESAMKHWVEVCGVGPWFYSERLPLAEFRYKGRLYDINMSVAVANSGEMQLELIQQRCDSPSMFRDFLGAGHEGMQHWATWTDKYVEDRDRAVSRGWQIGQEGSSPRGSFVYFLNEGHPGTIIELAEATPTRMKLINAVRDAAQDWDGQTPIREWSQAWCR
jgi:hypothetical protein